MCFSGIARTTFVEFRSVTALMTKFYSPLDPISFSKDL